MFSITGNARRRMARAVHDDVDGDGEHKWHTGTCLLTGPSKAMTEKKESQAKSRAPRLLKWEALLFFHLEP
jgi:hypothetical protein